MRKHLTRLLIAYTCFEVFRITGSELSELFRGRKIFAWLQHINAILLITSGFVINLLYLLISFIFFKIFFNSNKQKAIIYIFIAAFSIITLRYLIEEMLFLKLFGIHNYYKDVNLLYYYIDNIYYAVVYSAFGILYFLLQNEQKTKLRNKQLQLENQQAQLSFLQSQINPHFLFNNLNNIYSLVYQKSPYSLEAIAKLSGILRYMLYEDRDTLPLSEEMKYISEYIDLQQLRFNNPVKIEQQIIGDNKNIFIPPLIFTPFVENAFKHGNFKHDGIHINIMLRILDNRIDFSITNQKGNEEKKEIGGIGLKNIRKRLQLLYPDKHCLEIDENDNSFTVNLKITN